MNTEEFLQKLTTLVDEYEASNDNAVCGITFRPCDELEKLYIWNGQYFTLGGYGLVYYNSFTHRVEDGKVVPIGP